MYECQACGYDVYHLRFCNICWSGCRDLEYCDHCFSTRTCFGCVGLKRQEYCILNKRYTRPRYEELQQQIIEDMHSRSEWGEFFPLDISCFAYNESIAYEQIPLAMEEAQARGWAWHMAEERSSAFNHPQVFVPPDHIKDAGVDICGKILCCELTKKPYKIIEPELAFYKRNNIPLPRFCPDARHAKRLECRNPRILWPRQCNNCAKSIQTTYAPARPETVLCEACYHEKVLA